MSTAAPRDPERILVRAPNWIGDVVLSLAALRDLRRNFPRARIEVLARPWVADLYRAVAEVDAVRLAQGVRVDADALRGAFDAGVLLPNSFGSALPLWLARIPERWGYATEGRRPLLTRAPRVPPQVRGRSQVYYYRAMLAGAGLRVSAAPDVSLSCPPDWARSAGADRLLGAEDGGAWVGVNPGAFYGTAKRWLPERFAAVADTLADRGARIALVGGAAERPVGAAIAAQMCAPARVPCGETNLPELVGVLSRLRLLVTARGGRIRSHRLARDAPRGRGPSRRAGARSLLALRAPGVPDRSSLHAPRHRRPRPRRGGAAPGSALGRWDGRPSSSIATERCPTRSGT